MQRYLRRIYEKLKVTMKMLDFSKQKDIWYSFIGGFRVPCFIPGGSPWFEPAWSATKSSYEMGGRNGGPGRYDLFRRDAEQLVWS
jgi:hypothetical protein